MTLFETLRDRWISATRRRYASTRQTWLTMKKGDRPDLVVRFFLILMALSLFAILMLLQNSIYGL